MFLRHITTKLDLRFCHWLMFCTSLIHQRDQPNFKGNWLGYHGQSYQMHIKCLGLRGQELWPYSQRWLFKVADYFSKSRVLSYALKSDWNSSRILFSLKDKFICPETIWQSATFCTSDWQQICKLLPHLAAQGLFDFCFWPINPSLFLCLCAHWQQAYFQVVI